MLGKVGAAGELPELCVESKMRYWYHEQAVGRGFRSILQGGSYTLKLQLLYHLAENVDKFGALELFGRSRFELFHVHVKSSFRTASKRNYSRMKEAVRVTKTLFDGRLHGYAVAWNSSSLSAKVLISVRMYCTW